MSHRTIFFLAKAGYRENSATELLAFFLDPANEHQQGARFLRCLLRAAGLPTELFVDIRRVTSQLAIPTDPPSEPQPDKKIDLYIETARKIVVIKIKPSAPTHNALPAFAHFAQLDAERTGKDTPPTLLILGTRRDESVAAERGWILVSYEDYVTQLRADLERASFNKRISPRWSILTQEFVDHLGFEVEAPDLE